MKFLKRFIGGKRIFCLLAFTLPMFARANVNSWTNLTSGNWEDPRWSLGILPDSTQSIAITNAGFKAVAINPATVQNFPASLTIHDLTIENPLSGQNTLLLNFFNDTTPLRILDGLTINNGARLLDFHSGLVVENGTVGVTNADFIQDGGTVQMTNTALVLANSRYQLTNGVFEGGQIVIGPDGPSAFNQYGGTATLNDLFFAEDGGTYSLQGGTLNAPGTLSIVSYFNNSALFSQTGGTNDAADVEVGTDLFGAIARYTLAGGLLSADTVSVQAGGTSCSFVQTGGADAITDQLYLVGVERHLGDVRPGIYQMSGGTLSVPVIHVDSFGSFIQSNGVTAVSDTLILGGSDSARVASEIRGGTMMCRNVSSSGAGDDLLQTGGTFIVSNLLSFGGSAPFPGGISAARFTFSGGDLTASNIDIATEWFITASADTFRIDNPGYCRLGGLLQLDSTDPSLNGWVTYEYLGRFILASNAIINLPGNNGKLSFADSHAQSWNPSALLVISNWNGNLLGGGTEQLRFGTDDSGLTPAQLKQIRFRAAFPPDFYSAKILYTGEVVPDQVIPPSLAGARQGNNLILTWPPGWSLQTATNVLGPYADVSGATSPYTNNMVDPQRYFRLRQ